MKKRILSFLLILCMVLPLVPITVHAESALADKSSGGIVYRRQQPEVAVLNIMNSGSTAFRDTVKNDARYNAVSAGLFADLTYEKSVKTDSAYTISGWGDMVLNRLAAETQLEANYSATFFNNDHTHRIFWDLTSYIKANLNINGANCNNAGGNGDLGNTRGTRQGGGKFGRFAYVSGRSAKLTFSNSRIECYYEGLFIDTSFMCTCGGSAKNHTVTFRDTEAPYVRRLSVTRGGSPCTYFKNGDTVSVELTFNEPIRFSDDAAHGDIYVGLRVEGETNELYARLTEVNDNKAVFTYTVPADNARAVTVTGIDFYAQGLSSGHALCSREKNIPLRHVKGGDVFDIAAPAGEDAYGYTLTTAYLTDLAGNPAAARELTRVFYIDSEKPYTASVTLYASTLNTDVKEALGKTDPGSADYLDPSDRYLGVGDSFRATVYMNEPITSIPGNGGFGVSAVFNIKDKDGNSITARAVDHQLRDGVSVFSFDTVTVTEDMTVEDDGRIRLTAVDFGSYYAAEDASGNPYDDTHAYPTPVQGYELDIIPPAVTTANHASDRSAQYGDGAFSFDFTVSDGVNGSGTDGLAGSFVWADGDRSFEYAYALMDDGKTPADADFAIGTMGIPQEISPLQNGRRKVLFICPLDDILYDIMDSTLSFTARDYAGNTGTTAFRLNGSEGTQVVMSRIPPSAALGDVSRAYDYSSGMGSMTASVSFRSAKPLTDAWYLWTDSEASPAEDAVWEPLLGSRTGRECTLYAKPEPAAGGELTVKYLWVRSADEAGNTMQSCLGTVSYDLRGAVYALDYTTAVTTAPGLRVSELQTDDALLVLASFADGTVYAKYVDCADNTDLFAGSGWYTISVTDNGNGTYSLADAAAVTNAVFSDCIGAVAVSVLSGAKTSFTLNGDSPVSAGTASYPVNCEAFTLRVICEGADPGKRFSLPESNLTPDAPLNAVLSYNDYLSGTWYQTPEQTVLRSLAGREIRIDLGKDLLGWNFDDIDFSASYLYVRGDGAEVRINLPKNSPAQIVRLPDADYAEGASDLGLYLARRSTGTGYDIRTENAVWLDRTAAAEDLRLDTITYRYNGYGSFGICEEISARHTVDFDPSDVIHVPTGNNLGYEYGYTEGAAVTFASGHQGIRTEGTAESGYAVIGAAAVRAWNVTAESAPVFGENWHYDPDRGYAVVYETDLCAKRTFVVQSADSAAAVRTLAENQVLGLVSGQNNIIAVQTVYANGESSPIGYYTLYPEDGTVFGTVSTIPDRFEGGNHSAAAKDPYLVFTPDAGADMDGASVYCFSDANGDLTEMLPQADGTWVYEIRENDCYITDAAMWPMYSSYDLWVITVDKYGVTESRSADGENMISTLVAKDTAAPRVEGISFSAGDGYYTAEYRIYDTTLQSCYGDSSPYAMPPKLGISFAETYASFLGLQTGETFELTADYGNGGRWLWEYDGNGENPMGLISAEAILTPDYDGNGWYTPDTYMTVRVKGIVHPRYEGPLSMMLTVTDALDNAPGAAVLDAAKVTGVKPAPVEAEYRFINGYGWDKALFVTFSSPVLPEKSWINPDVSGYQTVWYDAFPITNDGDWEISYTDVFGCRYTETLHLENVFGEDGFDLEFSTLDLTKDPVEIRIRADDDTDLFLTPTVDGGSFYFFDREQGSEKTIAADHNGDYAVLRYDQKYTSWELYNEGRYQFCDTLRISLDNIGNEAPAAKLYFYLDELGAAYSEDSVPAIETTGYVTVSYDTARRVYPVDGTTDTVTFRPDCTDDVFTFTYEDEAGNRRTIMGRLSEYGITFGDAPAPVRDTEAPAVLVEICGKANGTYRAGETFRAGDDETRIEEAFAAVSYVQDYKLLLKISETSDYRILLLDKKPEKPTFTTSSAVIEGVTLSGNAVIITGAAKTDFRVAVVDEEGNYSVFAVRIGMLTEWFDHQAPAVVTVSDAAGLYERTVYVKVTDTADNGKPTDSAVTLTGDGLRIEKNTDPAFGAYQYRIPLRDSAVHCLFVSDALGNRSEWSISADGIRDDKPELTLTWTPCGRDGSGALDRSTPPASPVGTEIHAFVESGSPIARAEITFWDDYARSWISLADASYYDIRTAVTAQTVQVSYYDSFYPDTVRVTVWSPNGQSASVDLTLGENMVDRYSPTADLYQTVPLYRDRADGSHYPVPYALRYLVYLNDDAYCLNSGYTGVLYNDENLFSFVLEGEHGERTFSFVDTAGNGMSYTYKNEDSYYAVDSTAPVLSFLDPADGDTASLDASEGTVTITLAADEDCTLSVNGDVQISGDHTAWTVTVRENGTYQFTAADHAGNIALLYVTVNGIDRTLPQIVFDATTVTVMQYTPDAELDAVLETGYTAGDNMGLAGCSYDRSGVDTAVPGIYTVTYTAVDIAGNRVSADRYVKVLSADLPEVRIDGIRTEEDMSLGLSAGRHILTVSNLAEDGEPYSVYLVKGILTAGQIKYYAGSSVTVARDGTFTLSSGGYYTLYLVTQSRQTYRTLLYIEK